LIDINKIKGVGALSLLNKYEGKNPYIKKLKKQHQKNGGITLTPKQSTYIEEFHKVEPMKINRVVAITEYLGEQLKKQHHLSFTPKRILVMFMLADFEKTFHVYAKFTTKQEKGVMVWLPKTQVLDDPYWEDPNVEVEFQKYTEMDELNRVPYKHQEEGVKFLLSRKKCILADGMGMGKTIQSTIGALESGVEKVLIVCPSSMKIAWKREIESFGETASVINGKQWVSDRFVIINFDILKNFHTTKDKRESKEFIEAGNLIHNEIVNEKFDMVIVDEAHNLKNHKSIRGKIMAEVCVDYGVEYVWLLSGTPVANRPMDFYNLLRLIGSPLVENWVFYAKRYCDGKSFYRKLKNGERAKRKTWLTNGASNLEELAAKTRNIMLRRTLDDAMDMPDKKINTIYHELSKKQWAEYNNLWDEYMQKRRLEKKKGSVDRTLVELILLRQYMALQAIPKSIEIAENALEQDQKVIIFTSYAEELEVLQKHFGKQAVVHHGKMNDTQKQVSVDRFQNDDKVRVFIGNIISAGVGITLTAATVEIFNSMDWVPGNVKQAIHRAYRIGQRHPVNVYFNIFKDTIDEKVWKTLFQKTDIIDTILGSDEDNMFTAEDEESFEEMIDNLLEEN
jgi:SWI/SNF-related matrix-associated actin-dependent regulator of chromatin subfamily A-like protein 1